MSTTLQARPSRLGARHPFVAGIAGALAFGAALTAGDVFGLNSDAPDAPAITTGEVLAYVGMVLAAVLVAAMLGASAMSGSPERLAKFALWLAIASAAMFMVFWSGWPEVFGAVAVALALEHRRRVGGLGGMSATAAIIGGLGLVTGLVVCVIG
jgi:hypothetical protein